ncbi:hypothetical protein [Hyphomonas sp.]|uniref:hypothetical protein n=1 Tax=Hyphomonas sp. TaxID=87 RepID=UPI0035282A0D
MQPGMAALHGLNGIRGPPRFSCGPLWVTQRQGARRLIQGLFSQPIAIRNDIFLNKNSASNTSTKKRAALKSAAVKSKGGNARGVCTEVQDQIYAAMHKRARDRLPQEGIFINLPGNWAVMPPGTPFAR